MKKLILALVITLLFVGASYAENSATAYSPIPKFDEQTVYVRCYNPAATAITSNYVVIISMDANSPLYKATGSVIATTTSSDSNLVMGVTDEVIPALGSGRVCVRGPHRVYVPLGAGQGGALAAGATMASVTTAGGAGRLQTQTDSGAVFATLLSTTADPKRVNGVIVDNANLYWVWVRK